MKPTKFEIMRNNRADAANRAWVRGVNAQGFAPIDPEPAVPTMEIDGVRYREAPEGETTFCFGCAFFSDSNRCLMTHANFRVAEAAFGGNCSENYRIYIRAE
jgi:hypothetical protein